MAAFAPHVRWDRVGRMGLLVVGVLLIYLYIGPLRTWFSTLHEAKTKRAEVTMLQKEHRQLLTRKRALQSPGAVDTEARRLGMVRRDERAFVVRGLPRGGE
jgi:Septum formation initiator